MKVRGLLVAVAALAVLAGAVYWSNKREEAKKDQPAADAPPNILKLEKDNITKVEIRQKDADPMVVEKGDDGKWKLTAPEALQADQDAVGGVINTVSSLDSDLLVADKSEELATFGLDAPQLEVDVTLKGGATKKLLIGDGTPTGSNFFAKLGGDPRIFSLASYNKTSFDKSPWDLRDKRLLTFDSDKLSRVEVTAKGQTIEVGKNNKNEWQIVKPRPLRADGGNVEQLVTRLRDAKMDSDLSEQQLKEATAAFAQAARVAVAKVTDAAGTQEIEVRKTSGGDYYAKSSAVSGIHKVTNLVGEGLDRGLDDLRNKKLFDFGFSEPTRIELRHDGKSFVYEHQGDQWISDGKPMDSVQVRSVIDKLRDLSATAFPDSGFTTPVFEAKVSWDNGQRTDDVLISKSAGKYFAKRENEPSIYEVGVSPVDELWEVSKNIRELKKPAAEKKE